MRTTRISSSLLAAAALAFPAAAAADSIVYVDGGNVWSASPDGTKRVQLTDGGAWHSPTQADDGTIAAVKGTGPIEIMARDGRPLRTIQTAQAPSSNGGTLDARPVNLSFSPDGSKLAYSYTAFSCPPASSCNAQTSTFYTRADVAQATPQAEWGNQFGASHPEWLTNDRTIVQHAARVAIDPLGGGDYSYVDWLVYAEDFGDPEVSRDGTRLATTVGYGADRIIGFFVTSGDPRTQDAPGAPTAVCTTGKDEKLADPTWSPDGSGAAIAGTAGIEVFRFPRFAPGDCEASAPVMISPTGESPDWGPADVPAGRWQESGSPVALQGGGTPGPRRPPPVEQRTAPRGQATGRVRIMTTSATRAALRAGLLVRVATPRAGRVTATLTSKGRRVSGGSATARRAGAVQVKLGRMSAAKAKRLRGRKLTLTVIVGGVRAARTLTVR